MRSPESRRVALRSPEREIEPEIDHRVLFRFVDLFAGIGGMRAALQQAGGQCEYSVEIDDFARATYEANWGKVDVADVRDVDPGRVPPHEILAAGFPCQPFSLAGVSKKRSLGRAHGFDDELSGNLFFQIIRVIGGPWDLSSSDLADEAEAPDAEDSRFAEGNINKSAPPVLLLENVRHILSHDNHRTYRVIRRRLMRAGYHVSTYVINAAAWVPQNRLRTVIIASRRDLYESPLTLPEPPAASSGPKLSPAHLEHDQSVLARYRLTPGVWAALERHRDRHAAAGNGFGYGMAKFGSPTRTLSARYHKDGAEILIPMPDGSLPPRRLTPIECARIMGFTPHYLGRPEFVIPRVVSDSRAYRQFGNSVVVPQFTWIASEIARRSRAVFEARIERALVA